MSRVMRVVGVTESVAEGEVSNPWTTTVWVAGATGSGMCRTGLVPEVTVSGWVTVAKPGEAMVRR
jgi:hypothetical protein